MASTADALPKLGLLQRRKTMAASLRLQPVQFSSAPLRSAASSFMQQYDLLEVIGAGSVATVRVATRRADGARMAVKVVKSDDEEVRSFAKEEYNLMKNLDHDHLIRAHDFHEDALVSWIVMDLCAGGSVEQLVRSSGPLKQHACLTGQLFDALSYLHSKRIVHRDIKPSNLLLKDGAHLKVADFNSAKQLSKDGFGLMLSPRGTRDFVAPELILGRSFNERVDVWAAGLTVWFMLKSALPFHVFEPSVVACFKQNKLPKLEWEGISHDTMALLQECLKVDPADRPPAMELCYHHSLFKDAMTESTRCNSSLFSESDQVLEQATEALDESPFSPLARPRKVSRFGEDAFQELSKRKTIRRRLGSSNAERFHSAPSGSLTWSARTASEDASVASVASSPCLSPVQWR